MAVTGQSGQSEQHRPNDSATGSAGRRAYLATEYVVLYFGAVIVYTLFLRGTSPIPVLLVLAAAIVVYLLRSPGYDRGSLWRAGALRGELPSIARLWVLTALALAAVLALTRPELLLNLPRTQPLIWALIVVLYPALSVYPQELIFRAFLFRRYAPVFGNGTGLVAASAAAFGFVHIAFGNWVAVAMSLAGGAIFATRYRRTRSLCTVSVEHALYGILIFTIGLGNYFYHGAATAPSG